MKTFEYTITDELGIHARPAGMLVKEASEFASKIMIASPKKEVDAKRIMGVMSLGVKEGRHRKAHHRGRGRGRSGICPQSVPLGKSLSTLPPAFISISFRHRR